MNFYIHFQKNKNIKKLVFSKSGFTLVETLVAISILLLAILGPLSIATKGVSTSLVARDQVTAFYLAQEAIEHLKNMRDTYAISGLAWSGFVTAVNGCKTTKGCSIDALQTGQSSIATCSNFNPCSALYIDDNGRYTQQQFTTSSPFTRKVVIEDTGNSNEMRVVVTLSWQTAGQNKTFSIQENLYNIY